MKDNVEGDSLVCVNCGLQITDDLEAPYRYCPQCKEAAEDPELVIPWEDWKPF